MAFRDGVFKNGVKGNRKHAGGQCWGTNLQKRKRPSEKGRFQKRVLDYSLSPAITPNSVNSAQLIRWYGANNHYHGANIAKQGMKLFQPAPGNWIYQGLPVPCTSQGFDHWLFFLRGPEKLVSSSFSIALRTLSPLLFISLLL